MFHRVASALLILNVLAVAGPLRSLAEIRALSGEQAARHLPVEIEGTVTYFDANAENYGEPEGLVLHDGTAGCYASSAAPFKGRERILPGTRIRVKGSTNPNSYFPNIRQAEVEILGQGALPEMFLKMAFINDLTGSLDMCNGTCGLNEIMRRARGPKPPLNSTVVAETARAFIIYSGLVCLREGKIYQVAWREDAADAHFIKNREVYQVRTGTVKKGDIIKATLAPGGALGAGLPCCPCQSTRDPPSQLSTSC